MSTVAPTVEPAGPARTSGLAAVFEQTRYVLSENKVTGFAFALLILILAAAIFGLQALVILTSPAIAIPQQPAQQPA